MRITNTMITLNIASYKYGHLAAHAVESALCQTVPFDVIRVYDDGIGDCGHLKDLYPQIEVIERPENVGPVANFQDALDKTETEWCMMLGADNFLRPDTLEHLTKHDADIISYDIALFGTQLEKTRRRVPIDRVEFGYPIWHFTGGNINIGNYIHGSSLYRTDKAKEIGYKGRPEPPYEEDHYLFKGMLNSGATHIHVDEPLLMYRRHDYNFNQH